MRYTSTAFILGAGVVAVASCPSKAATQAEWQQCGGINWTGGTTCASSLTCVVQNPYYSQCLATSGVIAVGPGSTTPTTTAKLTITPTSSSVAVASPSKIVPPLQPVSSSPAAPAASSGSGSATGSGTVYKASFTHYGAGDTFGSPNCNTNTAACAFYTFPGFSAAVSQNLYGVGPGAGAGPGCGTCWKLTGQTDSSGNSLSNAGTSIVVMVNNLCPAAGNPLCAQSTLQDTNQYGANVNFDLCSDSGAEAAFFGNDGVGLAIGTAQQIDCSQWTGTIVH